MGLCGSLVLAATLFAGEPRRLTHDGRLKLAPTFLAQGRAVACSVHDIPNRVTVMRYPLTDGAPERLFPDTELHQFDVDLSRDGRFIVFARSSNSPQLTLVIKDTQENTEAEYRPLEARAALRSPCISPDSQRVAFGQSAPGGQQIVTVNLKGQDLRFLTRAAGINTHPDYSPDARHIAFSSSRSGDFEIYTMQADGGDVRRFTDSPGLDMHPAWSPDGRSIAFTSNRDGNYEIYVMNADGSSPRNVTGHAERDDFAAWHPDGRQIVTVSERNGDYDLYLFDASPSP